MSCIAHWLVVYTCHVSSGRSMIFITVFAAFFGRISGGHMGGSTIAKLGGELGCSEFSGVTSCPGLSVALGGDTS